MIARFIQRLTLFAFTAHAVLGCCWHHSHALGGDCCQQVSACHTDADELGEDQATHDHHCCGDHEHAQQGATVSVDGVDAGAVCGIFCCCEMPNNHSHECQEGHCNFTSVKPTQLDVDLQISSLEFALVDLTSFAANSSTLAGVDVEFLAPPRHLSSAHLCADLQSWQI